MLFARSPEVRERLEREYTERKNNPNNDRESTDGSPLSITPKDGDAEKSNVTRLEKV